MVNLHIRWCCIAVLDGGFALNEQPEGTGSAILYIMHHHSATLEEQVLGWLSEKASEELTNLLENKHLYQKTDINPSGIITSLYDKAGANIKVGFLRWTEEDLLTELFTVFERQPTFRLMGRVARDAARLPLIVPHASLFCKSKMCGRREAFAPIWYKDITNEIRISGMSGETRAATLPDSFQMFLFIYQCQRCLGKPESFLVRRDGWTLSLHGRSPIEHVELPKYIPETESSFYRDAIIAFNTGKVLAALFYLRTFIEQFARRLTGMTGRATGEEILDAYYLKLPVPTKDQMPSLREWYDKLSGALHLAKDDAALFEAAKTATDKHFDIRRVFNIRESDEAKT